MRAKCARTITQRDLSTNFVGGTSPSDGIRQSYTGVYETSGGSRIRIYVENSELRALQEPGTQSFSLSPVSESEFYVKEYDFSLSFVTDESTSEKKMIVDQGGQEYVFTKAR